MKTIMEQNCAAEREVEYMTAERMARWTVGRWTLLQDIVTGASRLWSADDPETVWTLDLPTLDSVDSVLTRIERQETKRANLRLTA